MRPSPERARYALIDGLRGLAACAVMLYHFASHDLSAPLERALPRAFMALCYRGWLGVHVFFVLSGFVIAHSVLGHEMTLRRALRFTARRQARLDPPYWVAIALYATGAWLAPASASVTPPSAGDIALHALYAWDVLGVRAIAPVFWSLAIEVQLYLAFVLALAALRRAPRLLPWAMALALAGSLFCAMTWRFGHAWLTQHAYLFALGVLVRWSIARRIHTTWPVAGATALVAAGLHFDRSEPIAGAIVAGLLLVAGARGALGRWLAARPLQLVGAASYGIYLFHTACGGVARVAISTAIDPATPGGALAVFVAGGALTIVVGALVHRTIEAWALRLAARVRWTDDGRSMPQFPIRVSGPRELDLAAKSESAWRDARL